LTTFWWFITMPLMSYSVLRIFHDEARIDRRS
jgi:hypothetical protein